MDGLSAERYDVIYREILETLMLSVKRAGMCVRSRQRMQERDAT